MKKVYVALNEDGYILAVFSSRESAQNSFPTDDIEEHELCEVALPPWTYWIHGARVYPDGTYDQWKSEAPARGYIYMEACDDHLNATDEPWDGHTQQYCGEHIVVSGTDQGLVDAAFQKHLATAIARQNGTCQSKFPTSRCVRAGLASR